MSNGKQRGRPRHPDILTPSEWRVADSVRHGMTNPMIAKRLDVSPDAVKFHVSNILGKLGLTSRAELKVWPGVVQGSPILGNDNMNNHSGPTSIGQIARTVSDISEARKWYANVLGLEPLMDAGGMAFFACNGIRLMLTEGEAGPESIIYFKVDDIHSEIERLKDAGAKIVSAPHRIHTHEDGSEEWMGFIEDCDGRPLGLMSVAHP